jgi:hypothetical protein
MSPEEHYFENLLHAYKDGGDKQYEKRKSDDRNPQYFSKETKAAIETCAIYIIDCCGWEQDTLEDFLTGDFRTRCGCVHYI